MSFHTPPETLEPGTIAALSAALGFAGHWAISKLRKKK